MTTGAVLINAKEATELTVVDAPTVCVFHLLEVAEDGLVDSVSHRLLLCYQQEDGTADGRLQLHWLKWSRTTNKTTLLERRTGGEGRVVGGGIHVLSTHIYNKYDIECIHFPINDNWYRLTPRPYPV